MRTVNAMNDEGNTALHTYIHTYIHTYTHTYIHVYSKRGERRRQHGTTPCICIQLQRAGGVPDIGKYYMYVYMYVFVCVCV